MPLPLVAIVGAPNVGKSTLFNRLVRRRRAIVTDEPGVTRDRLYGEVTDVARPFRVVDTGGLTPRTAVPFAREIEQQASAALDEASVVLFVIDVRAGATALDEELAAMLRRQSTPVVVVANKVESDKVEAGSHELHALGLGAPMAISAEHGIGIDALLDRIERDLGEAGPVAESVEQDAASTLNVAIVGRPNVGKSSLLNRLVGQERVVVSEIPGTTRDAIDIALEFDGRHYRLIDTAGIRRRGKVQIRVERFSVAGARRSIERCDVAVLVLDGSLELAAQDAHIAGYVVEAYKPMVVAVNKWDLIESREEEAKRWTERVRDRLRFAKEVPMLLVSAKTGQRVTRVLDEVDALYGAAGRTVPTAELNRWLQALVGGDDRRGGGPRLFYATQTGVHPPTFLIFCNDRRKIHFSLERRLANGLRETFGFGGAPIRLRFRERREETGR